MRLLKIFRMRFRVLLLFMGITVILSLPGFVRCSGEVDPHGNSEYAAIVVNR